MPWTLWPKQLVGMGLPLLGAVLLRKREKWGPQWRHWQRETHPYYDLQVKVLRARNIQHTDLLSKADCYVQLWLPTAAPSPIQTRTVTNCSDPEWNETFHYRIHGAVKNVLELTLCDKDVLDSDQLSLLLFDLSSLQPGQPHTHTFPLNQQDSQELQVEFTLEKSQMPVSEVITNGVLVAHPCLRIQATLKGVQTASLGEYGSKQIQLAVPGAYEKPQPVPLRQTTEPGLPPTFTFHVNPVLSPQLRVELKEKLLVLQSGPNDELEAQTSKLGEADILLSPLPLGQEEQHFVVLVEGQEVALSVKAEMSSGDLDLRLGSELCDGELEFLDKRKQVASKALQQVMGLSEAPHCEQVPVIAVLGSGGGVRAMTSLYGSLAGLQELGLLDAVTYLSGVSGSTWCISTLYNDPSWSQKSLQGPIDQASARVCSSKLGMLSPEQLQYYTREKEVWGNRGHNMSLTDFWGLIIEYFLNQKENPAKLSDQQEVVSQGQNPYPIYASVNVHTNISGEDFAEWCEFTPYEVGFPKYGAYVPTELFGSEFFMGRLLRPWPEPRICYLQGMWGSAFAASIDEIFLKMGGSGLRFLDWYREGINVTDDGSKFRLQVPTWLRTRIFTPQSPFSQAVLDIFTSRFTYAQNFNFTQGLCLHKDYVASREFVAWKDRHLDACPNQLTPMKDCLCLVDGGFAINSPFPLILQPQRAVDLIVSFDYSLETPFQVLQMTEKYCLDRGIPFPRIDVGPRDFEDPRECYLFTNAEDPRSPIVLHFPLVNRTFRTHLAPGIERQTAEEKAFGDFLISGPDTPYGMMDFTYEPEEFDREMAKLTKYNTQVPKHQQGLENNICQTVEGTVDLKGPGKANFVNTCMLLGSSWIIGAAEVGGGDSPELDVIVPGQKCPSLHPIMINPGDWEFLTNILAGKVSPETERVHGATGSCASRILPGPCLSEEEASVFWRLTVKVLEARCLPRADLLSEADPYVTLVLPTVPGTKFKTKTVTNSSHPVWNETFSFLIQSRVKNILELNICDEDLIMKDDICFKVSYDISEILPGKLLQKTFRLNPQGPEELDVEFLMERTLDPPENLITNNVLVARELSRLDVCLDRAGSTTMAAVQDKLELELVLKGSYEDTRTFALDTASTFSFHYLRGQDIALNGCLRSFRNNVWNSDISATALNVPLKSLITGKEVTMNIPATDAPELMLKLKTDCCPKELAVRLGYGLCPEEQAFLGRRKQVVAAALKQALQLDEDLKDDEVPVVGIMAEGGGVRAMISLFGHLLALQKLGLLDCVTYISGVSGSTWTMAHLYQDPEWSQRDLDRPISHAREHVVKSLWREFSPEHLASYHQALKLREEQGHTTTIADLWGLVLESKLHGQVTDQTLSGQRAALEQGQNPLPLYLSLNVKENNLDTLHFKEWVEFSPYEVGFLKYGGFVPSELFGSEFYMGRLMKRLPESQICFLEGIWSNIFSVNLMDIWYDVTCGKEWKNYIVDAQKSEEPSASAGTSSCVEASWLQPGTALAQAFKGFLNGRPFHQCSSNFLHGLQMHRDYHNQKDFSTWADCHLDNTPNQLTPQDPHLCLVDAGYFINNSCPSMFRTGRQVDLILSFSYSQFSHFEGLQQSEKYCRAQGLPFPFVEPSPEDQQQPQECHLFSDPTCPEAPVVLHFPLVNDSFRDHSAPGVRRSPAELKAGQVDLTGEASPYLMYNMTYKEEDFDRLLQLTDYNMRNSQDTILQALRTVLKRKAPEVKPSGM
ncbi:cytosolic phospholipase A2 zeta [Sigmodon hispidus]